MNTDMIQRIVTPLIELMESGSLPPWSRNWESPIDSPKNAITGRAYSGLNAILLQIHSYSDSRFIGFEQCRKAKGHVKAGSRSIPIVIPIFKLVDGLEDGEKIEKLVSFRLGRVFSISCCELDPKKVAPVKIPKANVNPIEALEGFLKIRNPKIEEGPNPCYIPSLDLIKCPKPNCFSSIAAHGSAILHEVAHWTGAKNRMSRPGVIEAHRFGSEKYGLEELTAEMFCFLARQALGFSGGPEILDSASYLSEWIKTIKKSPSILIQSCVDAEKALRWYRRDSIGESVEHTDQQEAA